MSSETVTTVAKMIDLLPESKHELVMEHLREYIEDLQDEMQWDDQIRKSSKKLKAVAQQAKQEIADGHAEPMDYSKL